MPARPGRRPPPRRLPNPTAISIIIPTWNNLPYLKLVVDSLRRHSAYDHQIIVHVNDGSDGTLDWVRSEGIEHTASPTNIGICHAVNAAARATRLRRLHERRHVLLPGLGHAVRRIEQMPTDLFMLSGTMVPVDTRNPCVVVSNFGRDAEHFDAGPRRGGSEARAGGLAGLTAPTLVHRDWWNRIGGYSSELSPGMSSDNAASRRARDTRVALDTPAAAA